PSLAWSSHLRSPRRRTASRASSRGGRRPVARGRTYVPLDRSVKGVVVSCPMGRGHQRSRPAEQRVLQPETSPPATDSPVATCLGELAPRGREIRVPVATSWPAVATPVCILHTQDAGVILLSKTRTTRSLRCRFSICDRYRRRATPAGR